MKEPKDEVEEIEMYCKKCGTCGFIGCCGIVEFLKKHVKGKTDCSEEASILSEIITYINGDLDESMRADYLKKCTQCKSKKCSGWHEYKPN